MNVTEHQATVAVDAAARRNYDLQADGLDGAPPFDDLHRTVQLELRELVLPIVWAALEALPDPAAELRQRIDAVLDDGACTYRIGTDPIDRAVCLDNQLTYPCVACRVRAAART